MCSKRLVANPSQFLICSAVQQPNSVSKQKCGPLQTRFRIESWMCMALQVANLSQIGRCSPLQAA
jgi:hypothetical protein